MVAGSRTPNSSVYLGDLAEGVTEELIYQIFAAAGSIQSIRLCRDSTSRKPLGYAYVNFAAPADATCALETLNHVELCGRQIRLMPSQRDPTSRRSGVGNVFAKNLHPEKVTNKVLHETFERFGRVLSAKVATDASGRSKGNGFVQFYEPAAADRAIESLHMTDLCGQRLFVGPFIPAKDRAVEPGKFCNVYVRNLGADVDEETLRTEFSSFGPISSTVVMRNKSNKSRGFGFVNYENPDHAAHAVAEMDGFRHNNVKWRVNRAQKRNEEEPGLQKQSNLVRSNLYLRNLDPSCTDEQLRALFQDFGRVDAARVLKDGSGKSKGVGFVQFAEPEDAEAAITGMNGKTMGGSPKPLFVTLAQRKQPQGGPTPIAQMAQEEAGLLPSMVGIAPPPGGMIPPNVAFYPPPAGPPIFYSPVAMPLPNPHLVPGPYFVPMANGMNGSMAGQHIALNQPAVIDRSGSLVSLPSGHHGMGSAPSAPLPRPAGSGLLSISSGPLPAAPLGHASAPSPSYSLHGEVPRRARRGRGAHGHASNTKPVAYLSGPVATGAGQPRVRPVLTSPFSSVQAGPPMFLPTAQDPAAMHARSTRSLSSVSSVATPRVPSANVPPPIAEDSATVKREFEQRQVLRDYIGKKSRHWADEALQMMLDRMNAPQIATLLMDANALAIKVDACIATLEAKAAPSCIMEEQAIEGSSEALPTTTCIPVSAN